MENGTLIDGKYRVLGRIGTGGMGSVYEATQVAIDRRVAVKILQSQFCNDKQVIERFHREARLAASIGHDNICEVTDIGTHEGAPYLVMPVLKGRSLGELLKEIEAPLSVERAADIICQTLSALQAAHSAGIIHRDMKPDNIYITTLGDREDFVKLLDFGISKVLESDSLLELTRTGTVVGTPFYMAPEQARGSKKIDHRLDIYAVGVIFYEALTGQRPYAGDSYNEIMFKIISEPFLSPRRLNPDVPEVMEGIILKAMAKDPAARYTTAAEMREACKEAVGISSSPRLTTTASVTSVSHREAAFTPTGINAARAGARPTEPMDAPSKSPAPSTISAVPSTTRAMPAKSNKRIAIVMMVIIALITAVIAGVLLQRREVAPTIAPLPAPVVETPSPALVPVNPAPAAAVEPTLPVLPAAPILAPDGDESAEDKTKKSKHRSKSRDRDKKTAEKKKEEPKKETVSKPQPKPEPNLEPKPEPKPKPKESSGKIRGRNKTFIVD